MTNTKPSMIEIHSRALEDVDEAHHEFLLAYHKDAKCVYGFVEGKDDLFVYRPFIDYWLPEGWSVKLIKAGNEEKAGNKEKVISYLKDIDWNRFSRQRVCFFVDRDLQDFLNSPSPLETNLYITDGYSIENSIFQDQFFREALFVLYEINLCPKVEEIIQENIRRFSEAMMPLMGQIVLWKRIGCRPNLQNLDKKLDKIFSFSEGKLIVPERKVVLEVAANHLNCVLCNDDEIMAVEKEISNLFSPWLIIRGKYINWFFIKQCDAIGKSISKLLPSEFPTEPCKKVPCGMDNTMLVLAPRSRPPASLKEFIQGNYLAFIQGNKFDK